MNANITKIADVLRTFTKKKVLVVTHVSPDGDAIGSSSGIAHLACHLSCDTRLLYIGGLPNKFEWLKLPCPCFSSFSSLDEWKPDLIIATDCGTAERTGEEVSPLLNERKNAPHGLDRPVTINIDHHTGNTEFADYNWVDPDIAATGQLIGMLAKELGVELSGTLGESIYLALVSDTGNFSYQNTKETTLLMASDIISHGLDLGAFTNYYENQWSLESMKLWGVMMNEISLHAQGKIAVSLVTRSMMETYGASEEDLEGFSSWMRRIKNVQATVFIREDELEKCRISMRSMGDIDVRQVATAFNGGGHTVAAGATLFLPIQEAADAILEKLVPLV